MEASAIFHVARPLTGRPNGHDLSVLHPSADGRRSRYERDRDRKEAGAGSRYLRSNIACFYEFFYSRPLGL